MASVHLDHITCRYGNTIALEEISFVVPDGAFWVLVGPSGCGKSTLLRAIAGLEPIAEGKLYIGEELVNGVRARQRDVAMVFQNYALYPHMTVAQNLAFGLRMRGVPSAAQRSRLQEVAQALDIEHLLERKPKELSGGQQQRVALGRAIARQPRLFLLDEPLSNLDAQLRDDTRAELKRLHQTFGITTLYVTHDQVEAMTLGDQVVVLDRGRIQQIGAPQAIYDCPANLMVAGFLGSPPMNLWRVQMEPDCLRLGDQTLPYPPGAQTIAADRAGQSVHLGIRPEHIQIVDPEQGHLRGQLALVEPLGRETLLRGSLQGSEALPFTVTSPPAIAQVPGDWLGLQVELSQILLFDGDGGQRLFP